MAASTTSTPSTIPGSECHGFEIELEDCHSTDITYTYDYNHYGTPNISEDDSVAGHPKCVIRWESKKNPDGTWAAFTAIPSGPIAPTNGHMFTNPAVNFGGEHFGVGYRVQPTAIRYNWLIDQGGALVHGGAVQVSTPTFTYYPPVAGAPPRSAGGDRAAATTRAGAQGIRQGGVGEGNPHHHPQQQRGEAARPDLRRSR